MSARVVVVGAGIAGVACARALAGAGLDVEVRDRSRVIGGRMASRTVAGRPVDSGASYLTARSPQFRAVVDDWVARSLARPWTDRFPVLTPGVGPHTAQQGPLRYAAPRGLRSLVADLAVRGGVTVHQECRVRMVGAGPAVDGAPVDAVAIAMPDPEAARLLDRTLSDERAAVRGRRWSPALALLAGYPRRSWPALDGAFVHDHGVVDWIADDGRRRGDDAPVLVAHSTPTFARAHFRDRAGARDTLLDAVRTLLGVSEPASWAILHRWRHARPDEPHEATYHLGQALVGLAGCAWGSPRVETAWASGDALGRALAEQLVGR